ncbi:MAG: hypothetical protein ACOC7P_01790 [Chloroflexota bacterium]
MVIELISCIPPIPITWAFAVGFGIAFLFLFPFKSVRNPQKLLKFTIRWMDCSGVFEIEPYFILFLRVDNQADIDQTIDNLKGKLSYSASYTEDNFPNHPLQNTFSEQGIVIKAKKHELLKLKIPILPETAERFKKYIEVGEYIFWSGSGKATISAKVWHINRGGEVSLELNKFPYVPTSRHFEGIENIL